jgi:hypothetical protein
VNYYNDSLVLSQKIKIEKDSSINTIKLLTMISCVLMPKEDELSDLSATSFHVVIIWKEKYPTAYIGYDNLFISRNIE